MEASSIRTKNDVLRPATWAPSCLKWATDGPGTDLPDRVADYIAKYLIHVELHDYANMQELTILLLDKWIKKHNLNLEAKKVFKKGISIKKSLKEQCAGMRRRIRNGQYMTNITLAVPILKD